MKQTIQLINADIIDGLKSIKKNSIDTIITSPPYWGLRNYQVDGQIGMEPTLGEYHDRLLEVTTECKRVLKSTGVIFWNHGDSYGGSGGSGGDYNRGGLRDGQPKVGRSVGTTPKCITMQNERLIIRMIDEQGWILRNRIIWHKPNGMPSSAHDRFTGKYEPVYMLVKNQKYHFDLDAVRVPATYQEPWSRKDSSPPETQGNNPRAQWGLTNESRMKNPDDVWKIPTQPHKDAHFAIFPGTLVEPMIKAACPTKVCSECGFIQERIIDKTILKPRIIDGIPDSNTTYSDGVPETGSRFGDSIHTTGWTSCDCDVGWDPGIVLDPFAGSGTTMKVAKKLGRNAIGIELNPDYCKIIKKNLLFYQHTLGNIENIFTEL